jgi:hypothetical protein
MNNDELRQEYRINTPLTVFIELMAADMHSPATIVISQSVDISANGLRIITDRDLPVGSILSSCVQLDNYEQRFLLSTEVKWSRNHKDEYIIGLALFESEGTDIQAWKEYIAAHFNQAEK